MFAAMQVAQSLELLQRIAGQWKIPLINITLKDQIPQDEAPRNGLYIFNLDNLRSGPVGTHWTGMWCNDGGVAYFDSFGAPPPIQVEQFVYRRYPTYGFNNWVVQDLKSNACGFYVLAFGAFMARNDKNGHKSASTTMNAFVNTFVDDTATNERILTSVVNALSKNAGAWNLSNVII